MNKIILVAISMTVMLASCSKSTKTKSGIEVTFIKQQNAGAIADNSILNYNMRYENENGHELFNTATRGGAVAVQYSDSTWSQSGLLYEALSLCQVGDSITFKIPAQDLYVNTFKIPVPDSIGQDSKIEFFVGLESAMSNEEFQAYQKERYEKEAKRRQKQTEGQHLADIEIIDEYLKENNIQAETTESGLRYVITKQGQGENAIAGQTVSAHYSGTLLDGTKFDSSYDRNQPFEFTLGQGGVIKGWDDGFALLNKGAKATLYIPSTLAYGPQARSAVIKANSILKFDVELVDIK